MALITALALSTACLAATQLPADAAKDYAELLGAHVRNGQVSYSGVAKDGAKLDRYLAAVAKASLPKERNARIGFWVDAYNAIVLKSVLDAKTPAKVIDVKDFFDRATYTVAGTKCSLNQLEKKILNPYAKDPRTHMVLVCAAVGCPILESRPYSGDNIDKRFDAATRRYLAGPTGALVSAGKLSLSNIFNWYEPDFGGPAGVIGFVKKHLSAEQAALAGDNPKVEIIPYDWNLNKG